MHHAYVPLVNTESQLERKKDDSIRLERHGGLTALSTQRTFRVCPFILLLIAQSLMLSLVFAAGYMSRPKTKSSLWSSAVPDGMSYRVPFRLPFAV